MFEICALRWLHEKGKSPAQLNTKANKRPRLKHEILPSEKINNVNEG